MSSSSFPFKLTILLCSTIATRANNSQYLSPPELIDLIVSKMWSSNAANCSMYKYNYGGAIIFDSMYSATDQFWNGTTNFNTSQSLDYNGLLAPILLDYLYNDTSTPAYMMSHGQTISFNASSESAIGDNVGLFPIAYLDFLWYEYRRSNQSNPEQVFDFSGQYATQWQVIFTTADYYILQFPRRLSDAYGTVSRDDHGAWQNEADNNASFVWADDNYMALTLLMRLVRMLDFCRKHVENECLGVNVSHNISVYVRFISEQQAGFSEHLLYPHSKYNALYAHGYNFASGDHSCCPWGRANAWIMTAHTEALRMFRDLNDTQYAQQQTQLIQWYHNQVNEVANLQDASSGRWHQIINDSSTFLETSCSAGFLYGILYGRLTHTLPTNVYSMKEWDALIGDAWNGVLSVVDSSTGLISQQCQGTGICNDVQQYEERSTAYCKSGDPGDPAFVINAIVSYQQYLNLMH